MILDGHLTISAGRPAQNSRSNCHICDPASFPVAVHPSTPRLSWLSPAPTRQIAEFPLSHSNRLDSIFRRSQAFSGAVGWRCTLRPGTHIDRIPQRLPGLECRRRRRPYREGLSGPRVSSGTFLDPDSPARRRGLAIAARTNGQPRVGRVNPLRRACFRAPMCARLRSEWPQRSATSLHVNPFVRSSYARWSRLRASMTRG